MSEAVQTELSAHGGERAPFAILEADPCRFPCVDRPQRRHRASVFYRMDRRGNPDPDQSVLWRVRYDLHSLLLSLPDLAYEEPMLHRVPHLQLGLCYDVYSSDLHSDALHLEPFGTLPASACPLGDHPADVSRAVFGSHKRLRFLQELPGEALSPQNAAQELLGEE